MEPRVDDKVKDPLNLIPSRDPVFSLARNVVSGLVSGYQRSVNDRALNRGYIQSPNLGLVQVKGEEGGVQLEEPVRREMAAVEAAKSAKAFMPQPQAITRLNSKINSGDYFGAVGELITNPAETLGFLGAESTGRFLEAQVLSFLPGPGTYIASFDSSMRGDMAESINSEVVKRGGAITDPDDVLDVLSDKEFLTKTVESATKGATALATTEVAVEMLAALATGGIGSIAPMALTRPVAKAVMRLGSEVLGESAGATAQQVAKGEEVTKQSLAYNLLEGLSTIGQSVSTMVGAQGLESISAEAKKVRDAEATEPTPEAAAEPDPDLEKARRAADHARRTLAKSLGEGVPVEDLQAEFEQFEADLSQREEAEAEGLKDRSKVEQTFKEAAPFLNLKKSGFDPEDIRATAKKAIEKLQELETRFRNQEKPEGTFTDETFLRQTLDETLPKDVIEFQANWSMSSSQPAARAIVKAYAAEPEKKERMVGALRERFGDEIPVFRGGGVRAEYQSWSTDPQMGFTFGGTTANYKRSRPFVEGFVRPEDVSFIGVPSEWELVVNSADVQRIKNTSIQEYRNRLAGLFRDLGLEDLEKELNVRETTPFTIREEFPERQVRVEKGQKTVGRREDSVTMDKLMGQVAPELAGVSENELQDSIHSILKADDKAVSGILGAIGPYIFTKGKDGKVEAVNSDNGLSFGVFPDAITAVEAVEDATFAKGTDLEQFATAGVNINRLFGPEGDKPRGKAEANTPEELAKEEARLIPPPTLDELAGMSGVSKAAIERTRRKLKLDQLSDSKRRAHLKALKTAFELGIPDRAEEITHGLIANPRSLQDHEVVGIAYKKAELEHQHDILMTRADAMIKLGKTEDSRIYKEHADVLNKRIDDLEVGARSGITEVARALSAVGAVFEMESMTLSHIRRRARVERGRELTAKEEAKLADLYKQLQAARENEAKALQKAVDAEQNVMRSLAEKAMKIQAKKAQAEMKAGNRAEKLSAVRDERAELLKELGKKGFNIQSMGLDPEVAWIVSKIAKTYIQEGVIGLDALVNKVMEHVPDLTRAEVMEGVALMESGEVKKTKAKVQAKIKQWDAQKAIMDEFAKLRETDPVKAKKLLNQLQNFASKEITDNDRLLEIEQEITKIKNQLAAGVKPPKPRVSPAPPSPEVQSKLDELRDLRRLLNAEKTIADLQQQLDTGIFKEKPPRKPETETALTPELKQAQVRLAQVKRAVRRETKGPTPFQKRDVILEPIRLMRQLITTGEMSGTLRQGFGMIMAQPTKFPTHFAQAFKAFFKEDIADEIEFMIQTSRYQPALQEMGVDFTYRQGLNDREELFMSKILERVPQLRELLESNHPAVVKLLLAGPASLNSVVRAAERHMTTFLNLYRFSIATQYLDNYGIQDLDSAKEMGKLINDLSGRSNFKAGPGSFASIIAFAPRFTVSRFAAPARAVHALGGPRIRREDGKIKGVTFGNPKLRKEAAAGLARTAIWGASWLGLASLAGISVGSDPEDSDFGKIVWGNTRIDIWGGFQQPYSWLMRMALAGKNIRDPEFQGPKPDGYDMLMRFALYKASPAITFPAAFLFKQSAVGEELSELETIGRYSVPLFLQDAYETAVQDGVLPTPRSTGGPGGLAVGAMTGLGLGVQTWGSEMEAGDIKPIWNKARYKPRPTPYPKEIKDDKELKQRYDKLFGALVAKKVRATLEVLETKTQEEKKELLQNYASQARETLRPYIKNKITDKKALETLAETEGVVEESR